MTPERLSRRSEFTPVPSYGSTFVYMIPPQNVITRVESPRREFTPVVVPGRELHSGTNMISQRYHVKAKRPDVSV